jgi:hypothetical protein
MPAVLPIITAISAALGIGTTAYSLASGGGGGGGDQSQQPQPATPTTPDPTQAAGVESANRAKQALIARGQLPGLQDQTGGSLSPDYYNTMAQEFSGGFGANPGTTNPGANLLDIASSAPAGPNNLPALLQQLQGMQGLTTGASITG